VPLTSVAIVGSVAVCSSLVVFIVTRVKSVEASSAAQDRQNDTYAEFRMNDPITLTPPPVPVANLSVRGKQQERMRSRSLAGKCLHCEERATHASPRWVLVKPVLEDVYRYLGVVPIDHWKIETHVRNDADKELCEWHHHAAVARMQDRNVSFE